jgi:hypothetical protein
MSDIPLIVACPVAAFKKLVDLNLLVVILAVAILDMLIMWTYLTHEEILSIDSNEVYAALEDRKRSN